MLNVNININVMRYQPLKRGRDQGELERYLEGFAWEWFVSLTVPDDFTDVRMQACLKRWVRAVYESSRLQLGLKGVLVDGKTKHIHAFMLSRHGSRGRSLRGMPNDKIQELQKRWYAMVKRTCEIDVINNKGATVNYIIGRKNIQSFRWDYLPVINEQLLKRKRMENNYAK